MLSLTASRRPKHKPLIVGQIATLDGTLGPPPPSLPGTLTRPPNVQPS